MLTESWLDANSNTVKLLDFSRVQSGEIGKLNILELGILWGHSYGEVDKVRR